MWLHFYDTHLPYFPPERHVRKIKKCINKEDYLDYFKNMPIDMEVFNHSQTRLYGSMLSYDSEIRYVDEEISHFYRYVQNRGLNENALWIITADHGEGLGQHQWYRYGKLLYQEAVHVPLIFYFSNEQIKPKRINDVVENIDIFPSLCEILGFSLEEKTKFIQGDSLFPVIKREKKKSPEEYAFYERRPKDQRARKKWEPGKVYGMQTLRYKYIFHSQGKDEFYDLLYDPYENKNLIDYESEEKRNLKKILRLKYDLLSKQTLHHNPNQIDEKHLQELKALGYIH